MEQAFWASGGKDGARLDAALAGWKALAAEEGSAADEAEARAAALGGRRPKRAGARLACP
ncbi:MAG TPA: hypothetical protein VLT61_01940 [Anaeromyxobacteraceae bacterium]|nr:hypothetical protein [Anaeromyxobacteraceae bacterium]